MKTVLSFFLLTVSLASISQETRKSGFKPYMMHGFGASFQEFEALDARIANFPQYKDLRTVSPTLQLGWLKERNNLISTCALHLGSTMSGDRDEKSSTLRFYGVSADIGYDVVPGEKIMLYPMVGVGYERYQAKFFKDNTGVDFDDVLESPTIQNSIKPVSLKNSFFAYRAGLGFALKSPKNMNHAIGLRAGYIGSFKDKSWRSNDDQELMNAPEDGLGRIYVSLTFMGSFMKHR